MEFKEWLKAQMDRRGWTQTEVARRSNLSRAALSNILSGRRSPNTETCSQLAIAFNLPHETVLVAAGLLEEKDRDIAAQNRIIEMFGRMTTEERAHILAYAQWFFEQNRS